MQLTGMLHGGRLLDHVGFPRSEVLGPDATEDEVQGLIDRHVLIFIKPVFRGGVGKKGKAGLVGRARDLATAMAEKERLYFAEHRHGNAVAKANGVTFEAGIPAEHEVYFSITPRRRVTPSDAGQRRLLRGQRRLRHLARPRRAAAEDDARGHPGLQRRPRGARRRPRLHDRRRLPAALGRARAWPS